MKIRLISLVILSLLCFSCRANSDTGGPKKMTQLATFAGGCFWCMQPPFDRLKGVVSTTVGYAGGDELNPTYSDVSAGRTGHAEVIQIEFDPSLIRYEQILEVFWHNIDPTVKNRQFCDVGKQYRTAIFFHSPEQEKAARESKASIAKQLKVEGSVFTEIEKLNKFYPAEDYHQKYYKKNPVRYYGYRTGCGRDRSLEKIWGKKASGK